MAAAAAGAGAGAGTAQEKQFPPALLSFFIYNPRFGPREGEVRGAGPAAGEGPRPGGGWPAAGPGAAGCAREAAPARPAPGSTCHSALLQRRFPRPRCARCGQGRRRGPGDAGRGCDQRLFISSIAPLGLTLVSLYPSWVIKIKFVSFFLQVRDWKRGTRVALKECGLGGTPESFFPI